MKAFRDTMQAFGGAVMFFTIAMLCACSNSNTLRLVERAEALAVEEPTEALDILQSIDIETLRTEEDKARYALVYSEALYYNYVDVDSDTLTRPMMEFYLESDSHKERARALYQHALVAQRMGELAEAMVSLMEAEESLAVVEDVKLSGLLHRAKGDIYGEGCLFTNALDSYVEARRCFDMLGLDYHSASVMYDMGGTLIQLRDFEGAHEALQEALAYAIEVDNREFMCGVLHELLDLSIYMDDYDMCRRYFDLFEQYDALCFGEAHYLCAVAMLSSYNSGTGENCIALIDRAETMPDVEWADTEYARYIVYRNVGNAEQALYWQEQSKNAQDSLMLEVLEQPVLNVQIEMLQGNLDAVRRERELVRQRNTYVIIIAVILIVALALFVWYRLRNKNRAIAHYVETISELELSLSRVPSEMAASVGELYRDRFTELNELCDIYYDHSGSSRHKSLVFNKLAATIDAIKSDERRIEELENAVNHYRDNLMARLRKQMPKLSERDMRVSLYVFAGFSNRAIAIFIDSDPVAVSKMKYNIRHKIKTANIPDGEALVVALSDK